LKQLKQNKIIIAELFFEMSTRNFTAFFTFLNLQLPESAFSLNLSLFPNKSGIALAKFPSYEKRGII
jgi:hypothetical protein